MSHATVLGMEKKPTRHQLTGIDKKALQMALDRHAIIVWMEGQLREGKSREECYRLGTLLDWNGRKYSKSTLERIWKRYRDGGFDALVARGREDSGKSRALSEELKEVIRKKRLSHPQQTVRELIRELAREGHCVGGGMKLLSSIYRFVNRGGLDHQSLRIVGTSGPTKAFEVKHINELWMVDVMYGPVIVTDRGIKIATRLIALIDDASRLIPHAQYRAGEKEEDLWAVMYEAFQRSGVPDRLYSDNGKIFTSVQTRATCARLGIRLVHAKPYAAWSKGKIERWFRTVQMQFESRLKKDPVVSLEQLNARLWQWIEGEYHCGKHGGLDNRKSPRERFCEDETKLRFIDAEQLELYFWQSEVRRVRRDATVSWRGKRWEAASYLRGQKVTLRFNPFATLEGAEVWHDHKLCGMLRALDRHVNSRTINKREDYNE